MHTVMFALSKGNDSPTTQNVCHGEKIEKPEDPLCDGYIFEGWFFNDEAWRFDEDTVTEDVVLVAKWTAIKYSIFYQVD